MIFLKHDFYSNFSSSVDAGDNNSIIDMLTNEISELIVYKREELIDFLDTVGVEVKPQFSDEKIINKILGGFPKNIKLTKGLAFLIYQNNPEQAVDKNVSNDKATTFSKMDMIASGIMGIGDSFEYHPQLKKEFKNDLLNKIESKAKAVGDRKIKIRENTNVKYWFWGTVIVLATVAAVLFVKYKNTLLVEGKPVIEPTPPVTPEAPVATEASIPPTTEINTQGATDTNTPGAGVEEIPELPPQAVI